MKNLNVNNRDMHWAAQIQKGNRSAFTNLFDTYYIPLYKKAYSIVNDQDICEDAVQEVFLWIWEQRECWLPSVSVRAYLYRAVYNRLINRIRITRFEYSLDTWSENVTDMKEEKEGLDKYQKKELKEVIKKTLEAIPEKRREILLLNLMHGYTYKEIAEIMGISVNTVNTQIYRARKVLSARLEPYCQL